MVYNQCPSSLQGPIPWRTTALWGICLCWPNQGRGSKHLFYQSLELLCFTLAHRQEPKVYLIVHRLSAFKESKQCLSKNMWSWGKGGRDPGFTLSSCFRPINRMTLKPGKMMICLYNAKISKHYQRLQLRAVWFHGKSGNPRRSRWRINQLLSENPLGFL